MINFFVLISILKCLHSKSYVYHRMTHTFLLQKLNGGMFPIYAKIYTQFKVQSIEKLLFNTQFRKIFKIGRQNV